MNQHLSAAFRDALEIQTGEREALAEQIEVREKRIATLKEAFAIIAPDASLPNIKPRRKRSMPSVPRGIVSGTIIGALKKRDMPFDELLAAVATEVGIRSETKEWDEWGRRIKACVANLKTKQLIVEHFVDGIRKYQLVPPRPT